VATRAIDWPMGSLIVVSLRTVLPLAAHLVETCFDRWVSAGHSSLLDYAGPAGFVCGSGPVLSPVGSGPLTGNNLGWDQKGGVSRTNS